MEYVFSKEEIFFLLGGDSYDFFPEVKLRAGSAETKRQRFVDKCKQDGLLDETGNLAGELHEIVVTVQERVYEIASPNTSLFGPAFSTMIYVSKDSCVLAEVAPLGRFRLSLLNTREDREAFLRRLIALQPDGAERPSLRLELSADEADVLMTVFEKNHKNPQLEEMTDLSLEQVSYLLNGVQGDGIQLQVFRPDEANIGAIALRVNTATHVAMRFVASPQGDLTCFETVPTEGLWDYVLDFRGK